MRDTEKLKEAIALALKGDWIKAHETVQAMDDSTAAWIHGVLHKIEGDVGNAQYWYRRADRPYSDEDPKEELEAIRQSIG